MGVPCRGGPVGGGLENVGAREERTPKIVLRTSQENMKIPHLRAKGGRVKGGGSREGVRRVARRLAGG